MAEPKISNMVTETSITVGVGDYVLDGIPDGDIRRRTFRDAFANGDQVLYGCNQKAKGFELGIGTVVYGPPDVLQRTTILDSSNAGNPVNWAAGGRRIVYCAIPASRAATRAVSVNVTSSPHVIEFDERVQHLDVFVDSAALRTVTLPNPGRDGDTYRVWRIGTGIVQINVTDAGIINGGGLATVGAQFGSRLCIQTADGVYIADGS